MAGHGGGSVKPRRRRGTTRVKSPAGAQVELGSYLTKPPETPVDTSSPLTQELQKQIKLLSSQLDNVKKENVGLSRELYTQTLELQKQIELLSSQLDNVKEENVGLSRELYTQTLDPQGPLNFPNASNKGSRTSRVCIQFTVFFRSFGQLLPAIWGAYDLTKPFGAETYIGLFWALMCLADAFGHMRQFEYIAPHLWNCYTPQQANAKIHELIKQGLEQHFQKHMQGSPCATEESLKNDGFRNQLIGLEQSCYKKINSREVSLEENKFNECLKKIYAAIGTLSETIGNDSGGAGIPTLKADDLLGPDETNCCEKLVQPICVFVCTVNSLISFFFLGLDVTSKQDIPKPSTTYDVLRWGLPCIMSLFMLLSSKVQIKILERVAKGRRTIEGDHEEIPQEGRAFPDDQKIPPEGRAFPDDLEISPEGRAFPDDLEISPEGMEWGKAAYSVLPGGPCTTPGCPGCDC